MDFRGLNQRVADLGHQVVGRVPVLCDRLDELHGAASLAFFLVSLVDTSHTGESRPGPRRRPVKHKLLTAVENPLHVQRLVTPRRVLGLGP